MKCAKYDSTSQGFRKPILLECPEGLFGHTLFIRDDRKNVTEFKLCEVRVFGGGGVSEQHLIECPPLSLKNGKTVVTKKPDEAVQRARFECLDGFVLWGASAAECWYDGNWSLQIMPKCQPISCGEPHSFPHAFVEFVAKRTKSLQASEVGDKIRYKCGDEFVMRANTTYYGEWFRRRLINSRVICDLHSNPVITNHSGEAKNKRDSLYPGSINIGMDFLGTLLAWVRLIRVRYNRFSVYYRLIRLLLLGHRPR